MTKKTVWILMIAAGIVWASSCSKPAPDRPAVDSQSTQSAGDEASQRRAGLGRPAGKGGPPLEGGMMGRGQGRGMRGWRSGDLVRLSDAEKGAVEINTARAISRTVRPRLQAMGKIFTPQSKKAIVSYAFPARIAESHVSIGDWVKLGQRLVTLQSEEVGTAKSEFCKALADCELARWNMEREKNLFNRGVGAQKNSQATEAAFKVAEASLNAAEKKLHVLGFTEEQVRAFEKNHEINPIITLFAPLSGKIVDSKTVLGSMIDQTTEILTIIDPVLLWVDAEIFERDIAKIRTGMDVEISVPAYPGTAFMGKISYIGDVLKEETRTVTVRTEVPNKDQRLKPGMFADITLFLGGPVGVLAVPEEAVLDDRDIKLVFVRADGGYRPQPVEVGVKAGGYWEILAGIREGDEVVTTGNYQLKSKMYDAVLKKAGIH